MSVVVTLNTLFPLWEGLFLDSKTCSKLILEKLKTYVKLTTSTKAGMLLIFSRLTISTSKRI